MAEEVGFEPTRRVSAQRFSRPSGYRAPELLHTVCYHEAPRESRIRPEMVRDAIVAADAYGRAYRGDLSA